MSDRPLIDQLRDNKPTTPTKFIHDDDAFIPQFLRNQKLWVEFTTWWNEEKQKFDKRPANDWAKNRSIYNRSLSGLALDRRIVSIIFIDWDNPPVDGYEEHAEMIRRVLDAFTYFCPSINGLISGDPERGHHYLIGTIGTKYIDLRSTIGCEIYVDKRTCMITGIGSNRKEMEYDQSVADWLLQQITYLQEIEPFDIPRKNKKPAHKVSTPRIQRSNNDWDGSPIGTDDDAHDVRYLLDCFKQANVDPCPENNAFVKMAFAINHALGADATVEFMQGLKSWDNEAENRIRSMIPDYSGVAYVRKRAIDYKIKFKREKIRNTLGKPLPRLTDSERFDQDKIKLYGSDGKEQNIRLALNKLGFKFRLHEMLGMQTLFPDDKKWYEITDPIFASINVDWLTKKCEEIHNVKAGWKAFTSHSTVRREVFKSFERSAEKYNPIREWLMTLQPMENEEAIDVFLNCYKLDCYDRLASRGYNNDNIRQYYRNLVILLLYGVIARSMRPGYPFDWLPVLLGEPGCGKGLGLRLVLPPKEITENGRVMPNEFYGSKCRIDGSRATWYINKTKAICELEELAGINKVDLEQIKTQISATYDQHDLKYSNKSEPHYRPFIYVGTGNNISFLPSDSTGERRFCIGDFGYAYIDGRIGVEKNFPIILNDDWRRAAFGHVMWLISNGYQPGQWSEQVESMRQIMSGSSQRTYDHVEVVLIRIVHILLSGDDYADFRQYEIPTPAEIKKHGLPIRGDQLPAYCATWTRLLLCYDKLLDRHRDKVQVACEHLGWTIIKDRKTAYGYPRTRGWAIPKHTRKKLVPTTVTAPVEEDIVLPAMTTQEEDDAKEAKSRRELDDLYLDQKLSQKDRPPTTNDTTIQDDLDIDVDREMYDKLYEKYGIDTSDDEEPDEPTDD